MSNVGLGQGLNGIDVLVPENLSFHCGDSLKGCERPLCAQSDKLEISCVPSAQQCLNKQFVDFVPLCDGFLPISSHFPTENSIKYVMMLNKFVLMSHQLMQTS